MNLFHKLVKVEKRNRQSLLGALIYISSFDNDFNGTNGIDYNWEITKKAGFKSNLDYLLNKVKDIEQDRDVVNTFISEWLSHDDNYYNHTSLDLIYDKDKNIEVISFVAVTDD